MDFSLQGTSLRDDFLSDVLQSRQDGGSFMGSQFSNMPPLMSRGLSSVETGSFYSGGEESVQEKSGTAGNNQVFKWCFLSSISNYSETPLRSCDQR